MRMVRDPQGTLDFQPSNLKLTNRYYAKYEAISAVLDATPRIVKLVHADVEKPLKYAATKGKDGRPHRYPSDTVLRILLCQVIENTSLRGVVIRIDDSHFLRRFTRIHHGPMMDFTTLDKLKNSIAPETWRQVNRALARYAVDAKLIDGTRLRLDTTAVETNVHWPTDSSLLWDVYRVLARLLTQAREVAPACVGPQRLHLRRAKRLHLKIGRQAARKRTVTGHLRSLYEALIARVEGICEWAETVHDAIAADGDRRRPRVHDPIRAAGLAAGLAHFRTLGLHVITQARRRVLDGEQVPHAEKLFSIFEPHTELLKRGKARQAIEFGHMVQVQQVEAKFITDYDVFATKPVEHALLAPALASHQQLFGALPDEFTADKGYYENMEALRRLEQKIPTVGIAKKGQRTPDETERERDPVFRHAQRFRAGVEGTISFLKRVLGLTRCLNKGWEQFTATVGAAVLAHNLLILARC